MEVYMRRPEAAVGNFDEAKQEWTMYLADKTTQKLSQEEFDKLYFPLPDGVRVETTDGPEDPGDDDPEC